jgi:hypothetical protein
MSILLSPDKVKQQDKFGIEPKKFQRTGKDTFVVEASGGNYFEGKITNPDKVKLKDSGRIILTNIGICIRKCLNRDKECKNCFRFSKLVEG